MNGYFGIVPGDGEARERRLQEIAGEWSVRGPDGVGVRGEGGCVAWMRTVYRDIQRWPRGLVLEFSNGKVSVRRFQKPGDKGTPFGCGCCVFYCGYLRYLGARTTK